MSLIPDGHGQARHALASGMAGGNAKGGSLAPDVSDHLDWNEFLQRQATFLQVVIACMVLGSAFAALQ